MEMQTSSLGLDIPKQHLKQSTYFGLDEAAITKWRATLPMADIGATAKQLFNAITELNQIIMPATQRFTILELLRPPLQLVFKTIKKHYINPINGFNNQKFAIANLAHTLEYEVSNGYKICIATNSNGATTKNQKNLLMYRIMQHYFEILVRNYQVYSISKPNYWHESYLLYQYTKENGLLEIPIDIPNINKRATPTIATIYLATLLFEASNPLQFRHSEQENIREAVEIWANLAMLKLYTKNDETKPSNFLLDLDSDKPPIPGGLYKDLNNKHLMVLNLTKLNEHITKLLKNPQNKIFNTAETKLANFTLQRLLHTWDNIITRNQQRFAIYGKMQLLYGLSAAHNNIGGSKVYEPKSVQYNNQNFHEVATLEFTEIADPAANNINTLETLQQPGSAEKSPALQNFQHYDCTLIDISPNGICLLYSGEQRSFIQPGELVAMRPGDNESEDPNNTYPWNIGVIRWIQHNANKTLQIGIEILAASAQAAGAQVLKDAKPACYFLRCLLLPKMPDLQVNATIITPIVPFAEGKNANVYVNSNQPLMEIQLTKQVAASSSYKQFEYTLLNNPEAITASPENATTTQTSLKMAQHNSNNTADNNEQFKSLWDKL